MNIRQNAYFALLKLRGQQMGACYRQILMEIETVSPMATMQSLLRKLFDHCITCVPYYSGLIRDLGGSYDSDPIQFLSRLPILTRENVRGHFKDLTSTDLSRRRSYRNSTGGSTGEPLQFIHDWEFADRAGAISLLFSRLIGCEVGQRVMRVWGSERDIVRGSESWKVRLLNALTNTTYLNAYCMTPDRIRSFVSALNKKRPQLIVAYADLIFDIAQFCLREKIRVRPQNAIIVSATTLYPFMRETIQQLFQCKVYNRYGSRELGDIACERPGCEGLWVAPWGNYLEIVDIHGNPVPEGAEGDILVTSLTNYAMPFIRYRIGDTGILCPSTKHGQVLKAVCGKSEDIFRKSDGTMIDPGYFESMMYFRDWVKRFQIIQKSYSHIEFRIVRSDISFMESELKLIEDEIKLLMGKDCQVDFSFVNEIEATGSGKYRYQISEIIETQRQPPSMGAKAC